MAVRSFQDATPKIGRNVHIDETAVVIGDVELGDDCSVWPTSVIRGDVHSIAIGARTNIQDGAIVHVTHDGEFSPGGFATRIGEDVTVGHRAIIHACTIGDRVLIGMGAIVMDGAIIGDEVMLGAGSLVPPGKALSSGWLYVGSPARPVRELKPGERRFLPYSAAHYVRLAGKHASAFTTSRDPSGTG